MRRWTGHGENKNRSTLIKTNKINKDMSTRNRTQLSEIMSLAWQFVKRNGYTMSEALKTAWANMKLIAQMKHRIVRFYFRKVDGTIREAYGTLKESMLPPTQGTGRKANETLQTYYDTERQEHRSFKRANLVEVCS